MLSDQDIRPIAPEVLRAYDIRGVVDKDLSTADLYAVGRAFGTEMSDAGASSVAVGYDGRLTSASLAAALVKGLIAAGAEVIEIGQGPTPMLSFATFHLETDAGLMITGSHNPPEFNGIKMTLQGRAFYGEDIQRLGRRIQEKDFVSGRGKTSRHDVFDAYVERLLRDFDGDKELTIAWDPGNGAAGDVVTTLTERLPGRHHVINGKVDGTFPAHHPDPTVEKNLDQLKALVAETCADVGLAFDGDGDRIGVIDRHGRVLWGDQLLVLLARDVLEDHPGAPILCDIKGSRLFFDEIKRLGGEPVMWMSGHSHIKSKMKELDSPLAGEMSAHIFFKHKYYGFDDATYAAIRLLSLLSRGDASLADLFDELPVMFNTPEIRVDCPDDRKFVIIEELVDELRRDPNVEFMDIDGVRVETDEGWWLLRASNTQPALVARCESDTEAGLVTLTDALQRKLVEKGLEVPPF